MKRYEVFQVVLNRYGVLLVVMRWNEVFKVIMNR